MSDIKPQDDDGAIGSEMKTLAEGMLKQLENGDLGKAVAMVNDLNQVRDRTLYDEIGRLTRALHESIKNLKIDSIGAGSEIENATDKLAYVVEMTDKSANRTMDLVEASLPLAADMQSRSGELAQQWQRFLNKELRPEEFRALSKDIQAFLQNSETQSQQLQGQLSDIMLAQDFQDLTGQVIHKVADLVRDVESRLVTLVAMAGHVDSITGITHGDLEVGESQSEPSEDGNIVAEGPQIDKSSEDVVSSQDDVDDLLSSLGF
ncbi:MAG: protein phosphatase CheZ [Saccharospirillaceae bacterium]|jgi:chemotaxis protein CheZ|nr:protein phosphatase [Thalassolituus sp. HI0120]MCH2041605.1 protein phosphatase CheZ [Saccharospirillaceae bacterium]